MTNISNEACKLQDGENGVRDLFIDFDREGSIVPVINRLATMLTISSSDNGKSTEPMDDKSPVVANGTKKSTRRSVPFGAPSQQERRTPKFVYDGEFAYAAAMAIRSLGDLFNHPSCRVEPPTTAKKGTDSERHLGALDALTREGLVGGLARMFIGTGYATGNGGTEFLNGPVFVVSSSALWRAAGEAMAAVLGDGDTLTDDLASVSASLRRSVTNVANNTNRVAMEKESFYFNYIEPVMMMSR